MEYPSKHVINVYLTFGTNDLSTLPTGVDANHPEFEYYTQWRLTKAGVQAIDPQSQPIANALIRLHYDRSGRLTGTTVDRI
jgi:hypothetical protein